MILGAEEKSKNNFSPQDCLRENFTGEEASKTFFSISSGPVPDH